jgi:hypothetical protein
MTVRFDLQKISPLRSISRLSMADVMIMSPLVAFILSFASSHRLISDERRVAACVIAGLPVVCLIGVYVAWVRA